MSLRNDLQAQRNVTRAARRNTAIKRAAESVVGQDARPWESLETRVMMSMVHHYQFNEGAGTSTVDIVGARNGTLMTDTNPAAGDTAVVGLAADDTSTGISWRTASPSPAGGSYLHFNAEGTGAPPSLNSAGGRVDVAPDNALTDSFHNTLGHNVSLSAYIRFTDLDSTEYVGNDTAWQAPAITGNENASWGNDTMLGSITASGQIGIQKSDGARATSPLTIRDGAWHQVVVTRDYDSGQARVYVDGRLVNTTNTNAGVVNGFWDSIGALALIDINGTAIQGYNYLNNVDLDDVRMFNHVLTQGEVNGLVPAALTGPLTLAPVITSVVPDGGNGRLATINFTDANPNEAGFIIERATLQPNGQPGAFVAVGQTGSGATLSVVDRTLQQFNQQMVYRVRPFNPSGEGLNAVSAPFVSSAQGLGNGVGAGYMNVQFWGSIARVWGADPDPSDAPTLNGANNQAENVGAIRLDPAANGDPHSPQGIPVRDADTLFIDPFTYDTAADPFGSGTVGRFRRDWGTGAPLNTRADNFSTVHSARLTIPTDMNQNGTNGEQVLVKFVGWADDDVWVYINGKLVSTDPDGHGARDGGDPGVAGGQNIVPFTEFTEGQVVDMVVLQSEGGGGAAVGVKWGLITRNEDGSLNNTNPSTYPFIANSYLTPVASVPAASNLTLRGTPTSHSVSFNIEDLSTSEQRFDLYRRPTSAAADFSGFVKVNEAGINSPFISDAGALPGVAYDYVLIGVNNVSGFTPTADAVARKVTVTTAPADAVTQGLNAFYFNEDFQGKGEIRPFPQNGDLYVGPAAWDSSFADVFELGKNPQQTYGDTNHDPAVVPGGSPHPDIRDDGHSTLWVGKLNILPGEEGLYYILGFGDDDTTVVVDNVITSFDPNGHGARNPIPGSAGGQPTANNGFVNQVNLTAGDHDIVIMQSEQGGGSGIFLRWLKPGQAVTEVPTDVPATQLNTAVGLPAAPGAPTATDGRGTSVLVTGFDNATNDIRNSVVVATDAAFTQNVRRIPFGIQVNTGHPTAGNPKSFRLTGLTPGTNYFIKHVAFSTEGSSESPATAFNSGALIAPTAPSNVFVRPQTASQNIITFNDNSPDETGFVIQRRVAGGTYATIAQTGPGITTYTDALDPVAFPPGTVVEYQVMATNNGVNSAPGANRAANTNVVNLGGPGGTGLQMRVWTTLLGDGTPTNPDEILNNALARIAEPARNADGTALAPAVDKVDALIPNNWGTGVPTYEHRDADTFAIEWVGWIVAEETKAYEFSVITDDGARLFLDDVQVIDGNWRDQGDTEAFAEPVSLTAGQKVKIRFQMYEQGGGAAARLRWNGANNNGREDIPAIFMFPDAGTVDPTNAVAEVPNRPVSATSVFALPNTNSGLAGTINIHWQDNAFGELGYDIQRADNPQFTNAKMVSRSTDNTDPQNPIIVELVGTGRDTFVDTGVDPITGALELDFTKTYYYRVKPRGTPDTAYVLAGSAQPFGSTYDENTGFYFTPNKAIASTDLNLPNFPTAQMVTVNGRASVTSEKTIKLTHNQNDRWGSAFLNRAFDIENKFTVTTDLRMGDSNGADGMAFVIHNFNPSVGTRTPTHALGGGGGAIGLTGIGQSVAVVFDFHDALDTLGVYTNGKTPPGGNLAQYTAAGNAALRTDPQGTTADVNGSFDLRNTANLTAGTAAINVDGGARWRLTVVYDDKGVDADGSGGPSAFDTGLMTISLSDAADATGKVLFTAKYSVDLASIVGTDTAIMGWTAGTGGLNAKQEVYNFKYDGVVDPVTPTVSEVYVRGADWLGQDNNATTTNFMEYLEAKGLGDDVYGYRLYGNGAPTAGPAGNGENILPWINMNQIVVRYVEPPTGAGVPTTGTLTVTGMDPTLSSYTVTAVTPVAGDATAFVLTLNKPLGGGNPATGVAPTFDENGDYIRLGQPGAGPAGSNFSLTMKVLQGDTDHLDETSATHAVLARDFAEVKKRFFKDTTSAVVGDGADYTPFHDVDGSGSILARDFAEVKKRFFQDLPAPPAGAAGLFGDADRIAEGVLA